MEDIQDQLMSDCREAAKGAQDVSSCMPLSQKACEALRRLRAPAVEISYHLSGRILPDPDKEKGTVDPAAGGNRKVSDGCLTVRLLDLGVVVLVMTVMGKIFRWMR